MKKFILTAFLISLTLCAVVAQNNTTNHIVKKGETLYRLSVMYKLSIPDIKAVNPNIVGDNINIGDIVKIPVGGSSLVNMSATAGIDNGIEVKLGDVPGVDMSADKLTAETAAQYKKTIVENPLAGPIPDGKIILASPPTQKPDVKITANPSTGETPIAVDKKPKTLIDDLEKISPKDMVDLGDIKPVRHIVSTGETLYGLSKMYNQSLKALQNWNDLSAGAIKNGQGLIVGWLVPEGAKALAVPPKPMKPMTVFERKYFNMVEDSTGKYKQKAQTGIATWFDETEPSRGDNMYALHKDAPLFSIVRVTNPLNNRSIYVKVIQKLPDNTANEGVLIRLTSSAAKELNILDEKSQVSTRFFVTN
ncbi:MAG: LysM peptidoglycan-binding domain-containing protein [Chitinophagales bacterium]